MPYGGQHRYIYFYLYALVQHHYYATIVISDSNIEGNVLLNLNKPPPSTTITSFGRWGTGTRPNQARVFQVMNIASSAATAAAVERMLKLNFVINLLVRKRKKKTKLSCCSLSNSYATTKNQLTLHYSFFDDNGIIITTSA